MKTYMAKPQEVSHKWWVVDARDKVVGRLASDIAMILMGNKLVFSGKKWGQKRYTWYTGYPGLRAETAAQRMAKSPSRLLTEAVRRMLPKNKLAAKLLQKLKVYAGDQHPHQAQQPEPVELGIK
jgi:large subunit ribosomal protein L13